MRKATRAGPFPGEPQPEETGAEKISFPCSANYEQGDIAEVSSFCRVVLSACTLAIAWAIPSRRIGPLRSWAGLSAAFERTSAVDVERRQA